MLWQGFPLCTEHYQKQHRALFARCNSSFTKEAFMKFRSFLFVTLLSLAATLLVSSIVFAQQAKPTPSDDEVNAVARGLYCPVCENIPLDVCPTQACAQWRDLIRQKLSQGWSGQQIKDYFVTQYGDRVLAQPPVARFNYVFYVGLFVLLVLAVAIFTFAIRGMRKPGASASAVPAAPPEPPAQDQEYVARLEEELKKRG
jgi:cytochrome c-type biogenesis protein CcmH